MNKINLTRLRELAAKAGEGSDPMEKQRNADAFTNTLIPLDVISLIDEIERLKKALKFYSNHGSSEPDSSTQWHGHTLHTLDKFGGLCEEIGPNAYADEALKEHSEKFE